MFGSRKLGASLVIIGVLANNYVYLHDLVLQTQQGAIVLGWMAAIGIIVTLAVIGLGLMMLLPSGGGGTAA